MPLCAFLTLQDRSGFFISDHLLHAPFRDAGWQVQEIAWDASGVDWAIFDAVIIRSTWDYQRSPDRFLDTLRSIQLKSPLFNPLHVCQWNLNKTYLKTLQESKVTIVPTIWPDSLATDAIVAAMDAWHTDRVVVKPVIGANADDTFILNARNPDQWQQPISVLLDRKVMLQPFVNSIVSHGEYSLFYFGGEFSHAILKRPAAGDFRVQEEHGGIIKSVNPGPEIIAAGERALRSMGETLLYARVDLVTLSDGSPAVMELELIEPSLYFEHSPTAASRFTRHFLALISRL